MYALGTPLVTFSWTWWRLTDVCFKLSSVVEGAEFIGQAFPFK